LKILSALLVLSAAVVLTGADNAPTRDAVQYDAKGWILRPNDYREWIFLSSGLGMTYGPQQAPAGHPRFDNVFVSPPAYHSFLETGRWPDQTVLVLEVRDAQSNGSINRDGHFQTNLMAIETHVKDEKRGGWAFYSFPNGAASGRPFAPTANCFSCHSEHGTVDTTFVQFYPTLLEVAQKKGTLKPEK
jgi:hypothetical protein